MGCTSFWHITNLIVKNKSISRINIFHSANKPYWISRKRIITSSSYHMFYTSTQSYKKDVLYGNLNLLPIFLNFKLHLNSFLFFCGMQLRKTLIIKITHLWFIKKNTIPIILNKKSSIFAYCFILKVLFYYGKNICKLPKDIQG